VTNLFVQLWLAHAEHLLQRPQAEASVLFGSFVQERFKSGFLECVSQSFSKLFVVKFWHLFE